MRFDIVTIFPEFFDSPLKTSLLKKASDKGLIGFYVHDIRKETLDKHHKTDDTPYGGGAGMVMTPQPLVDTIESIPEIGNRRRILMSPRGRPFTQEKAHELSALNQLVIVCGRYEGIDERVIEEAIDEEISVGDYIISGGEAAALIVIEAVTRLIRGVLGNEESTRNESFTSGLLEYPQYTKPYEYRGRKVPDVLLSGNHAEIERWRREQSERITKERRPDLLKPKTRQP